MEQNMGNLLATANYINDQTKGLRVLPTATAYVEIGFIPKKLIFRTQYNQDIGLLTNRKYIPSFFVSSGQQSALSKLDKGMDLYNNYIIDNTITYTENINLHGFSVMLGNSVRMENWKRLAGR
ncbi:MAG: hypothetical protein ACRC0A_01485 [Chitinophagaceae bacterium]